MNHTSEYPNSPDIVIVNVKSRSDESSKCLPIHFSGDDACRGSILFYICFDPETSKHTVKYLIPHDTTKFPLLYKGEDGTDPQPGCSGSPIIEARVLVTRDPVWQFRVVGMVYARCPYSLEVETSDTMVIEEKLVCAIPVRFDFEQIRLGILMPKEMAWRDEAVANVFRESKPKIAEKYYALAESSHSQADKNFQEFIEGKTDLDISLPNGLEKLVGNRILKLEDSLLLLKNQKRHRGKEFPVTVEGLSDLKADYAKFMGEMRNIDKLGLRNQDDIFSLNGGYFRVDCSGSIDNGWKLDIQDNMGKISGKPFRLSKSEPGSSVFAIVKLPKGVDSISGLDLAMLFERSMDAGIAVEMVPIKEQLTLKRK